MTPDSIPYVKPLPHETERVRDAIERAKRIANERDKRREPDGED